MSYLYYTKVLQLIEYFLLFLYYIPSNLGKNTDIKVIIKAEMNAPMAEQNNDFLKSNFRKAAIAVPVHTPVVGIGIAINVISTSSLYFSNFFLFLVIFFSINLYIHENALYFPKKLNIFSKKNIINGTGNKLPK